MGAFEANIGDADKFGLMTDESLDVFVRVVE